MKPTTMLEDDDFDEDIHPQAAAQRRRAATIAADEAFIKALTKAIRRKRERATPGTHVDLTPPINAVRIRPEIPMSCIGSPAAMCAASGSPDGGGPLQK